jgi:hypothetical protein
MNFFQRLVAYPVNITVGAYHVATFANIAAALGIFGGVAQSVTQNQPLLNIAFGNSKGALISLAAIAISHLATTMTAHGDPIGGSSAAPSSLNVSASVVTPEAAPAQVAAQPPLPTGPLPGVVVEPANAPSTLRVLEDKKS